MYKHILVPVDKSETSQLALFEAARLAVDCNATVRITHVIDLAQFAWGANEFVDVSQLQQGLREAGQTVLDARMAEIAHYNIKVEATLIEVWGGALAKGIVDEAANWPADLIVMGTHGYSGLTHLILGSVAEGVMRAATVPILLVRNPAAKSGKDKGNDTE